MSAPTLIETARFSLRELKQADVTERYLGWLHDEGTARFIHTASAASSLDDLRRYVGDREGREDVLFLGIFDRASGAHVGNVKFEPLDSGAGYAVMGILIGEAAYRGIGLAAEVLQACASYLAGERRVRRILLGVDQGNAAAIRAYEKVGFVRTATPLLPEKDGCVAMVWDLPKAVRGG